MATERVKNTSNLLNTGVSYSTDGTNDFWTKSAAGGSYNAGVIGKKGILTPDADQSVRLLLRAVDKQIRFGFISFPNAIGSNLRLSWELIPSIAKNTTFEDTFSSGSIDLAKWTSAPSGFSISGGEIVCTNTSGLKFLESVNSYNLTDKCASVKFVTAGNSANFNDLLLSASNAFSQYYGVQLTGGSLKFLHNSAVAFSTAYNPAVHIYGRVRFSGGVMYGDYSTNGLDWINVGSVTLVGSITALKVFLFHSASVSDVVRWDDVFVGINAENARFRVVENGTVVFTSSQTPGNDNELRVQVVLDGTYKAKYYWRLNSGSAENLEYTSLLNQSTIQSYFPVLPKGEIFTAGGELANLQIEATNFSDAANVVDFVLNENFAQLNGTSTQEFGSLNDYTIPTTGQLFPRGLPYKIVQ